MATDINNPKKNKPIPRSRRSFYSGNPDFTGIPPTDNRGYHLKRSDDTFKNVSIGLKNINEAIEYYFKEVLALKVIENGQTIDVPVMYGQPEKWKAARTDGYLRDIKGRIIAPVLMYKRTSISSDDSYPVDKINRNIHHITGRTYNSANRYDNFSQLYNLKPTEQYYKIIVPDYVRITYDCIVWTSLIEQMDSIIEALQYNEGMYWGDQKRYKFLTRIRSFDQSIEISTDQHRAVKTNFSLEIRGYLIPEFFGDLVNTQKAFTVGRIIVNNETEVDLENLQGDGTTKRIPANQLRPRAGLTPGAERVVVTEVVQNPATVAMLNYLLKEKVYKATIILPDDGSGRSVVIFSNVTIATAPAGYPSTTKTDFIVFVNGQYVEHNAMEVSQVGNDFYVYLDISELGFIVNSDDKICVWGKFD